MAEGDYLAEYLERDLETLLQNNLSTALDTVEAEWAGTDPVTLTDPANWDRGYRAWMLDLPSTSYPYILTIIVQRTPDPSHAGRLKQQAVEYAGTISAFIVADTEAEAVKFAHRYAQAICSVLQSQLVIQGCKQRDWKPAVSILSDNSVHLKAGASGDTYTTDDVDNMRLVEVDVVFREL